MKKTKILLSSILTIMLCVSLITGATFALFTSESSVNIAITSGKVDVKAEIDDTKLLGYYYSSADATERAGTQEGEGGRVQIGDTTAVIAEKKVTISNFIPGYGFEFGINVTNYSSVSAKYSVQVAPDNKETDSVALFNALEVKVESVEGETRTEMSLTSSPSGGLYSNWAELAPVTGEELTTGKVEKNLIVTVEFPYEVEDNTLQGKTCNIQFAVTAVQANANADDPEVGKISVFSALDLKELAAQIEEENGYEGKTIVLMRDIDFTAAERAAFVRLASGDDVSASGFTPIGNSETPFKGTFDGQYHTIKNLAVEGKNVALFGATDGATIQHLVIENASVKVTEQNGVAGVLVAEAENGLTISDVIVKGSTVEAKEEAVGATVGGLVGSVTKREEAPESTVKVESSTFEGTGASGLVGKTDESVNVEITDSTLTDTDSGETAEWDSEGNRVYFAGSEEELTDILKDLSENGGARKVTLSADVKINDLPTGCIVDGIGPAENWGPKSPYTLGASADKKVDLTIDLNGNNLTLTSYLYRYNQSYVSYVRISAIKVTNGSALTITDSSEKPGLLSLVTCGDSPISVSDAGSVVTFSNINVDCKCTYGYENENDTIMTGFNPAIKVKKGGTVNLLKGVHITAIDDGSKLNPYHPDRGIDDGDYSMDDSGSNRKVTLYRVGYIASITAGKSDTAKSTLNIDGATIEVGGMVTPFVVGGKYSEINFSSGEITSSSGNGCAVFLINDLGLTKPSSIKERSTIRMTGGTINMIGEGEEPVEGAVGYGDYMIAITDYTATYGYVYVSGGVFNLKPTSGIAVGVAAYSGPTGSDEKKVYRVGGNVTFNVNATNGARAAAIASHSMPFFYIYKGLTINLIGDDRNYNIDFFWVGNAEITWEVSQKTNHMFRGSKPSTSNSRGMIDKRSEAMPEN